MTRVCTRCTCIIDYEREKECPLCGEKLEPYNPEIHVNYMEVDIDGEQFANCSNF